VRAAGKGGVMVSVSGRGECETCGDPLDRSPQRWKGVGPDECQSCYVWRARHGGRTTPEGVLDRRYERRYRRLG
jgi:hypothetical protein